MASRWRSVVVDAVDPARLARWWAEVLDYRIASEVPDEVVISRGLDAGPDLVFLEVKEPKSVKNRLHLEITPDDQAAEVERLIDMGARQVAIGQPPEASWRVLADPEGNEFCVLAANSR